MADLYLDPVTGDLVITNDLRFTAGIETVRQRAELRMGATKGEWAFNLDDGIDYNGAILGQPYDQARITAIYRKRLVETDGVDKVTKVLVTYTGTTRTLNVTWEAIVGDEVISGSLDL